MGRAPRVRPEIPTGQLPFYNSATIDNPPPSPAMDIPQPPQYSGTRDAGVVEGWLFQVANYLTLASIEEKKKLRMATCFLKGDAITWYLENRTSITTYADFEIALRDYFIPSNYISILSTKFKKLNQGQFSSVAEYATAVSSMGRKLKLAEEVTDKGIRSTFVYGLNAKIRHYLIVRKDSDSLSNLIKSALALEESFNTENEREKHFHPRTQQTSRTTEFASNNWKSREDSSKPHQNGGSSPNRGFSGSSHNTRPRLSNEEHARRYMSGECFGCGKKGHVQRECRWNHRNVG
jgi:Retrotransposon gag protein